MGRIYRGGVREMGLRGPTEKHHLRHGEPHIPAWLRHPASRLTGEQQTDMTRTTFTISPGTRIRAAMALAIVADLLQVIVFPIFVEGVESPPDDILDVVVGGVLVTLLGWHWEFLPSFAAKLVPGVDLVPFWTMAVANVYRKSKRIAVAAEEGREESPALKEPPTS